MEAAVERSVQQFLKHRQAAPPSKCVSVSDEAAGGAATRLIIVANRLPLSVKRDEATGKYIFRMSSGGLVSALVSVRSTIKFTWIGWLGQEVAEADQAAVREQLWTEHRCVPVFLTDALAEAYYAGMSNAELWPRFHYEDTGLDAFDTRMWDAYKRANGEFAKVILKSARRERCTHIWVHDYHLMVLPYLLKRHLPAVIVGWFLHVPWPSSEMFRALPVRTEVLRGLLAADLIGFHTFDYARHFLSSCLRVLADVTVTPTAVVFEGRRTRITVKPIGIEPVAFSRIVAAAPCQERIRDLCAKFSGMRLVVSVDRLDPIKGMPHRLLGIETFFRDNPQWVGKVQFLQVAVPSRTDVSTYQRLTSQVNQLVGSINATFGSLSYQPVLHLYRSVEPTELCALYAVGDVCLVASLRDGMNLVASEYVACQELPCALREAPGVLVLSEFAGSAQSLAGAIHINPWDSEDVSRGILKALTLPAAERWLRWRRLHDYVSRFTSENWASSFVEDMQLLQPEKQARGAAGAEGAILSDPTACVLLKIGRMDAVCESAYAAIDDADDSVHLRVYLDTPSTDAVRAALPRAWLFSVRDGRLWPPSSEHWLPVDVDISGSAARAVAAAATLACGLWNVNNSRDPQQQHPGEFPRPPNYDPAPTPDARQHVRAADTARAIIGGFTSNDSINSVRGPALHEALLKALSGDAGTPTTGRCPAEAAPPGSEQPDPDARALECVRAIFTQCKGAVIERASSGWQLSNPAASETASADLAESLRLELQAARVDGLTVTVHGAAVLVQEVDRAVAAAALTCLGVVARSACRAAGPQAATSFLVQCSAAAHLEAAAALVVAAGRNCGLQVALAEHCGEQQRPVA